MLIIQSVILSAFSQLAVGTRVMHPDVFNLCLWHALEKFTFPEDGQGVVPLPADAVVTVSSGVARREGLLSTDFLVRKYRGRFDLYAKRHHAVPATSVSCVVYTTAAYCADPDVEEEERKRILGLQATHVLVAVLASVGETTPPPGAWTFVHNLAGGNNAYIPGKGNIASFDLLPKIIREAKAIQEYWSEWIVVAD